MARNLRLKVGDWVMWKHTKAVGRVYDVSLNSPKEYHEWGLYSYKIAWNDSNLTLDGWTIKDLTSGTVVYIEHPNSIKVLYGPRSK